MCATNAVKVQPELKANILCFFVFFFFASEWSLDPTIPLNVLLKVLKVFSGYKRPME